MLTMSTQDTKLFLPPRLFPNRTAQPSEVSLILCRACIVMKGKEYLSREEGSRSKSGPDRERQRSARSEFVSRREEFPSSSEKRLRPMNKVACERDALMMIICRGCMCMDKCTTRSLFRPRELEDTVNG
jgi:hypothetical protein